MASRERSSLLVITRDGSVRAVLSRFLRSRGFVVKTAAGADEARVVCDRWRPDLVIVEAQERFDRSLEAIRELREKAPAIVGVPVVLGCKGAPPRAAADAARELGVAEIVAEPFSHMDELVLIAAKVLASLEQKPAPEPAPVEPAAAPACAESPAAPAEPAAEPLAGPLPFPASGPLATATVVELLHGCHAARLSGWLTLRHGATQLAITVERGGPCHATSSDPEGSFEAFLERSGRLGPEERRLLREASSDATLRQVILGKGLLSPHELFRALASHLRELCIGCIAWEDGDYELERGPSCCENVTPIHLDAPTLIRAGIERHYDLERLEQVVAAADESPLRIRDRSGGGIARGDLCLSTQEARLYELAARGSTVGEICKAAGNRVSGLRFLVALLVMDVIDLQRVPKPAPAEAAAEPEPAEDAAPPPGEGIEVEASEGTGEPLEGGTPLSLPDTLELADPLEPPRGSSMPPAAAAPCEPLELSEPLEAPESPERADHREPSRPSKHPGAAAPGPAEEPIEDEIPRLAEADYFELLGLARDASTDDVHAAFRRKAARFRPEALVELPAELREDGIAVYQRILEGYRVLANAQQRARYLEELQRSAGPKARPRTSVRRKPEAIEDEPAPEPTDRLDRLIAAVERALADLRMGEALQLLKDARKEHSTSPRWMAWYGWVLYREAPELNLHEAERFLGRARIQAPSSPEPYLLMARLRAREGATDRALELYHKALSLDPGSRAIARELEQLEADRDPGARPSARPTAEPEKAGSRSPAGTLSQRGRELVGILKRLPFGKKP